MRCECKNTSDQGSHGRTHHDTGLVAAASLVLLIEGYAYQQMLPFTEGLPFTQQAAVEHILDFALGHNNGHDSQKALPT